MKNKTKNFMYKINLEAEIGRNIVEEEFGIDIGGIIIDLIRIFGLTTATS
jgi:hypothetical protein